MEYKVKVWDKTTRKMVSEFNATAKDLSKMMQALLGIYDRETHAITLYEVSLKEILWRFEDELSNNKKDNI